LIASTVRYAALLAVPIFCTARSHPNSLLFCVEPFANGPFAAGNLKFDLPPTRFPSAHNEANEFQPYSGV
jgi:hypothetical protein